MSDTPPSASWPAPAGAGAVPATGPAAGADVSVSGAPPAGGSGGTGRRPGVRRRRTRWRAAFFALAALSIVGGVGWALLGDRLFVVRSVTVTGTRLLAPEQVIAAADVPLGTPLLSVDAGSVTRRVEAISQVASVTVTEDWPNRLVIAVTERVPVMAVRMAGGGYDLVDSSGVIVRWTETSPAVLPVFATSLPGSALKGNPEVGAAAAVLAELQPWLARQVAGVAVTDMPAGPRQVTLVLRGGKTVQWGSTDNAAEKNRELSILLSGQARDVDVSAPGTVVVRLTRAVLRCGWG